VLFIKIRIKINPGLKSIQVKLMKMFISNRKRKFIFLIVLACLFYISNLFEIFFASKDKPNVNIINLNKPILPIETYNNINCRLSSKFYVSVTICVHDLSKSLGRRYFK
jgi:hypothetical protein